MIKIIIGPTASGKSALAVDRALQDGGVIINADAMQCYDALPILTAQPGIADMKSVPHRLYSVLGASESMSAADWAQMATTEIEQAQNSGHTPYLVGGTGMYIKALTDGLSPMPEIPDDLRASVRNQPVSDLYKLLLDNDPVCAARLKPGDTQRIMRAAEVFLATNIPLSEWQNMPLKAPPKDWVFYTITINPPKEVLEQKIYTRLKAMLDNGALHEVEALSNKIDLGEIPENAPLTVAHGFRHLRQVLKGKMTLPEAIEATTIETRQYTKRQRTWLRHQIKADEAL